MALIDSLQEAIREEHLDGWLFCNFSHRDALTDTILSLDPQSVSSRRWFLFVPSRGDPVKIVHSIEKRILDSIPGERVLYSERTGLEAILSSFRGKNAAMLCDPYLQVLSTVDAASFLLAQTAGVEVVSAAALVQRMTGILDADQMASHEKAASILYRIVHDSWTLVEDAFRTGKKIHEGDIIDTMMTTLERDGLVTDHPPIVAAGKNSGDPHYAPQKGIDGSFKSRGKIIEKNDIVQFDIWAKQPGGAYADISWIGYCGSSVPEAVATRAQTVFAARDLVFTAIETAFESGNRVTGAELDARVRAFLLERFPKDAVQHRTGHGIDTRCHGSGVNLDSTEFPDNRYLLEGSCFSVEPGIYFNDGGFRTEIDIYIRNGKPVISGGPIQHRILTIQE
jgi:Xaa-Pro dipeptidase